VLPLRSSTARRIGAQPASSSLARLTAWSR
jgi:hypothetical protein